MRKLNKAELELYNEQIESAAKNKKMENLTQWQVWVTKGSQPIIMSLPFNNVNTVFEFLCENLNKRPVSISKLN
jgi:hypothetical protein